MAFAAAMPGGFAGWTRPERAEERNRGERSMIILNAPGRNRFFCRARDAFFLRFRRLRRQGHRPDHADGVAKPPRRPRVAQLQGPASGMAHDLARPAVEPPAKGLDAHRLAARVQHVAHQREQVEREHAQHEMQRIGSEVAARGMRRAEAAAKLADAIFGVVAPAVVPVDHPRVAPPAEAGRQGPVDVAALRQGVAGLRAIELELLLAGFSKPLHHHRERFGRVVHRVQEPRRLLRLARRPVALDEGLPPRLVQRPDLLDHARVEPGADRVADSPAREVVDDPRLIPRRVDAGATRLGAFGQRPLALADELEVARVRRDRAAPELRRHRHAGLGDMADDRHVAPLLLACGLRRRLLAVHRGRVDVQGHPFPMVQRDRQQPAVHQLQGMQRAALRSAAPQPPAQGIVARQPADAEQLQQRPLLAQLRHSAQMPRALVHHQHERRQIRPRAQAAVAARLRHQPLEMGVEPQLADQLGQRRQAASRSQFVFRGRNLV